MKKKKRKVHQFRDSKRIRKEILGDHCELCGEPAAIGHHVNGKASNDIYSIQNRCWRCEKICHDEDKRGNPRWAMAIVHKNNAVVQSYLADHRVSR